MSRREPADVAVLAARLARAYASLSPYSAASLATELCAVERSQRLLAVRACNGDYSERSYARAGELICRRCHRWRDRLAELLCGDDREARIRTSADLATKLALADDPRGAVLLIQLPGEPEGRAV